MNSAFIRSFSDNYDNLNALRHEEQLPRLSEVLDGSSPKPWDLAAFETFLDANYCGEIIHFTTEVATYKWLVDVKTRRGTSKCVQSKTQDESGTLMVIFNKIISTFVCPDSPQEINIPSDVRSALLAYRDSPHPPDPVIFNVAVNMMYDLMAGLFVQFLKWRPLDRRSMPETSTSIKNDISKRPEHHRVEEVTLPVAEIFPFYERAHKMWNPARVYRSIKRAYPRDKRSKTETEIGDDLLLGTN